MLKMRRVAFPMLFASVALVGGMLAVGVRPAAAGELPLRRVWVEGDSVMVGAAPDTQASLVADGWDATINAFPGLQLTAAAEMFRQNRARLGPVVVVELGSNFGGASSVLDRQIDGVLGALSGLHVIWLTDAPFRSDQAATNAEIRAAAGRWPNVEVADWSAVVVAHPGAAYADGVHLTPAGRALMASFVQAHLDAWYHRVARPVRPLAVAFGAAPASTPAGPSTMAGLAAGAAATPSGAGYWLAGSDGSVLIGGDAVSFGSAVGKALTQPIVGMAATPDGGGYWLVASDGGIFTFGDARFAGSAGNPHLNQPIVAMAATPSGKGYWLVASDGGVFTFGDAGFFGSTGHIQLNQPIVGMAVTPTGKGYWLVASDGGIFSFGDAGYFGSTGGIQVSQPVAGMAPTPDGGGYWFVAADGGVFNFGDAHFYGSAGGTPAQSASPGSTTLPSFVAIASRHQGDGYWLVGEQPG